jgi:hypothetical protein
VAGFAPDHLPPGRYAAPETIKFAILRGISEGRRVVSGTVGDFDMRSPVVRNISIDVATEVQGAAIRTTAGQAFADLQKGIRHCFVDYALVFEPRTGK